MADLLRKGYTMLNLACPICKNPIFRNKSGDMFCPKCDKPVIFSEDLNNRSNNTISEIEKPLESNESIDDMLTLNFLHTVILEKINLIANQLNSETEVSRFDNYIRLFQKFLKILLQIQRIKNS
jgi:uncharacterized Zn finger protein (UPF0148 family)